MFLASLLFSAHGYMKFDRPPSTHSFATGHVGESVHFTDLMKDHSAEFTKNASRVIGIGDIDSYAGFFTTNTTLDNNMFIWYFPAQNKDPNAPLVIWLQGGPGGSSMFGLFAEMGPFDLDSNLKILDRPTSWNKKYAMLFIDNPVGAGFSYTTKNGYCTNTKVEVAQNLHSLLKQFYQVFTEQQPNDLYITGESYAGHYVPGIAAYIHAQNPTDPRPIPLKGIAIGDGWVDPVIQVTGYPTLMFSLGLANTQQQAVIQDYCDRTEAAIKNNQMLKAFDIWDEMLNGDEYPYPNYFHNITGSNDYDNFMNTNAPESFGYYYQYLQQAYVRNAIHVGNHPFNDGSACEKALLPDFMVSFKQEVAMLMDNYKVLIYSGQLDIIIGASLTELYLPTIQWSGQNEFNSAERKIWRLTPSDPEVAGYVTTVKDFTWAMVRGAGHIVPADQPERALDMITRFIDNLPYPQ
jgi:vitellogenic carboxypeptidase-like protein